MDKLIEQLEKHIAWQAEYMGLLKMQEAANLWMIQNLDSVPAISLRGLRHFMQGVIEAHKLKEPKIFPMEGTCSQS